MTSKIGWVKVERCPICKSKERHLFGNFQYPLEELSAVDCIETDEDGIITLQAYLCKCGYGYTHKHLDDMDRYYAEVYFPLMVSKTGSHDPLAEITGDELKRAERQAKQFSTGEGLNSLDVGCGSGQLMKGMAKLGWTTWGLDPRVQELKVFRGIEEIPETQKFDMITMSHVLEHVSNPIEWLEKFVPLLANGGQFFIEVPSITWKTNGLFSLHHVGAYTIHSLVDVIEKAGLTMVTGGSVFVPDKVEDGRISMKVVLQAIAGVL